MLNENTKQYMPLFLFIIYFLDYFMKCVVFWNQDFTHVFVLNKNV